MVFFFVKNKGVCIALACCVSSRLVSSFCLCGFRSIKRSTGLRRLVDVAAGRRWETLLISQASGSDFPFSFPWASLLLLLGRGFTFRTQTCLFVRLSPSHFGPICPGRGTLRCSSPEGLPQCPGPGG